VRMYDRADERGWWHAYGLDDKGFVSLEADAVRLCEWQFGYIPGLLQTEGYMRANFANARQPMEGKTLDNAVAIRLHRQRRLREEPFLELHAVIDESVLRRHIADEEESRNQLRHLAVSAGLPTVRLQMLPLSRPAHSGRGGPFTILRYPWKDEPDIAYIEHPFGSFQTDKEAEVRAARVTFTYLAGIALNEADSVALIKEIEAEI
jgi:hypothetical protein